MTDRSPGIAFILLTIFIDILGIGIVIPVLPELVMELIEGDESDAADWVGLITATYAAMQFVFAPVMGALSDRFGRRPILLASLLGLAVDFVIQGLATSIGWLIAGRAMAGMMGASVTTANAYIADISNDDTRARNFGLVGVMFGLGFICGPALGGYLGGYSLRLPFFVAATLAVLNAAYGFFVLPESLSKDSRRTGGLNLRTLNPLDSLRRLRAYPMIAGLSIVFALKALAQRGLETSWVLFTTAKFDWTIQQNGFILGWVGFSALIVQGGLVRPAVARFGKRKTLLFATVVSSIAFAGYAFAPEGWMIPCIIAVGALGGLAGPAIQSLVTERVADDEQGAVQGALTSLLSLTSIAAPLLFTKGLLAYFTSDEAPIYFPGAPLAAGAVLIALAFFVAIAVFRVFPEDHPQTDVDRDAALDRA